MKNEIFISYRRKDTRKSAIILHEKLKEHFNTFLDKEGIDLGAKWPETLNEQLKEVSIVLVLIGPNWINEFVDNENDWMLKEISVAMTEKKHIIPVLIDGTIMPAKHQLPEIIRDIPEFQATNLDNYYSSIDGLIKEVNRFKLLVNFGREADHIFKYGRNRFTLEKTLSSKYNRVIYLGNDKTLDRKVIIRVFKDNYGREKLKESIFQAVEFARSFPYSVQILDAETERTPLVILEYMKGGTLRKKLKDNVNGLIFTKVAQILTDIGQSLVRTRTTHCNLKPSNILLSKEEIPHLNSMSKTRQVSKEQILKNIAKDQLSQEDLNYLAPEIFDDTYKDLSEERGFQRIDQYMLGLLGYELLSGKFSEDIFSHQELMNTPPSKEEIRKRIGKVENCASEVLGDILYKMTHPDPKDRYEELAHAINDIKKTIIQSDDIDIVRKSYLRCLNTQVSERDFLETFYFEFIKKEEIKPIFEKFDVSENDKASIRKQSSHLQGAIFGLIEYANEMLAGKKITEINFLKHVAERHSDGERYSRDDKSKTTTSYFIGVKPVHFNYFLETLLHVVGGHDALDPFDKNCSKSEEAKNNILDAWNKVLKPGIEFMKDHL